MKLRYFLINILFIHNPVLSSDTTPNPYIDVFDNSIYDQTSLENKKIGESLKHLMKKK